MKKNNELIEKYKKMYETADPYIRKTYTFDEFFEFEMKNRSTIEKYDEAFKMLAKGAGEN